MKPAPEPPVPVHLAFRKRIFTVWPGVRITWEALSVGMEDINARQDAQPLRRVRAAHDQEPAR